MLPAYVLIVNITEPERNLSKVEFQDLTFSSLNVLYSLKGAFDKKPLSYEYLPPIGSKGWSLRCILMISVGKERGEHLLKLYTYVVNAVAYEVPELEIEAETSVLIFS